MPLLKKLLDKAPTIGNQQGDIPSHINNGEELVLRVGVPWCKLLLQILEGY